MADLAYQPSMLDEAPTGEASLGPLAGHLRRIPLSRGAWLDHLPGWVHGSDSVLRTLLDEVDWRAERRVMYDNTVDVPRLLRWYDGEEPLPHVLLAEARPAHRTLRGRARRAIRHGGDVSLPHRPRQCRLAR